MLLLLPSRLSVASFTAYKHSVLNSRPPPFDDAEAMTVALRFSDTPAEASAKLLMRLGVAALFVGLPCAGIFWRGAIYVVLPVGAILILLGALLDAPPRAGRRLRDVLVS